MSISALPEPIKRFFDAINAHSTSSFITTLTSDISMVDQGKAENGIEAVSTWHEFALAKTKTITTIQSVTPFNEQTCVAANFEGDYEAAFGSNGPFLLYCYFTLRESLISAFQIDDIAPDVPRMRCVYAAQSDMKDPLSVVRYDVRPIPEIPEGWVRVKVHAAALNYHDLFICRGIAMHKLKFPLILGMEASGTLDDGSEVILYPVLGPLEDKPYKLPQEPTIHPQRSVFGEIIQGTLAEYVITPRENLIPKPKDLSHEVAAVLGTAWLTAYRMLFPKSGLKKGDTMLVQGSAGGIATALIQLGAAARFNVWSIGRTGEKRALAKKLGAAQVFAPGEALPTKVQAVFNFSGGQAFTSGVDSLVDGGTLLLCGSHAGNKVEVDLQEIFVRQLKVWGNYVGEKEDMEKLVAFMAEKGIKPHISEVLPLERAAEGLRKLQEGFVLGKCVVKI